MGPTKSVLLSWSWSILWCILFADNSKLEYIIHKLRRRGKMQKEISWTWSRKWRREMPTLTYKGLQFFAFWIPRQLQVMCCQLCDYNDVESIVLWAGPRIDAWEGCSSHHSKKKTTFLVQSMPQTDGVIIHVTRKKAKSIMEIKIKANNPLQGELNPYLWGVGLH